MIVINVGIRHSYAKKGIPVNFSFSGTLFLLGQAGEGGLDKLNLLAVLNFFIARTLRSAILVFV
jgi:hypothetical protein